MWDHPSNIGNWKKKSVNAKEPLDISVTVSHPQCTVHHHNPGIHTASGYLPLLLAAFTLEGKTHLCCDEILSHSHEGFACFRTQQLFFPKTAVVIELFHFLNASRCSFKAFSLRLTFFPWAPLSSPLPGEDNAFGFKQYFILKRQINSVWRLLMDTKWDGLPLPNIKRSVLCSVVRACPGAHKQNREFLLPPFMPP